MKTVWINPLPSISESEQQEGVEILEGNNVIKVIIHPIVIAEDNDLDVAEMYREKVQNCNNQHAWDYVDNKCSEGWEIKEFKDGVKENHSPEIIIIQKQKNLPKHL